MRKEYDFSKGKRGPLVPGQPGKTRITIRLDDDARGTAQGAVRSSDSAPPETVPVPPHPGIILRREVS
jgi:hypothetical protein